MPYFCDPLVLYIVSHNHSQKAILPVGLRLRQTTLICGSSSFGRARPCQGRGGRFEPGLPLKNPLANRRRIFFEINALVVELVDTQDLKSCGQQCP